MVGFGCVDCALAESITIPEAPAIAREPAAEVFKKLRREDFVISSPLVVHQFIADRQMQKAA
jgi:hypothetical protein